jgi:hypothetical protein
VWTVKGFGSGKGSGGANAPIHFGDTPSEKEAATSEPKSANGSKPAAKASGKPAPKKTVKTAAAASASRKARR